MALKQLVLSKKLEEMRKQLLPLDEERETLETRAAEIKTRAEELEKAVEEVTEETTDEDKAILEGEVNECLKEQDENEEACKKNREAREAIENKIAELEKELEEIGERTRFSPAVKTEKREAKVEMETRKIFGMNKQERDAFFEERSVKEWLDGVRSMGRQKRNVTGAELLIPEVVLPVLRDQTAKNSKLMKHVNLQRVPGKARQNVMGEIPEAIWTEQCAKLNELGLTFNGVELDGYKIGGFIPVCNAILEDSDEALGTMIIDALAKSLGLGLDKAILYGTGVKMPLGIVTRLAQEDLAETNLVAVSGKTDAELFKAIVEAAGAAKGNYTNGSKFWAMNEKTFSKMMANALSINAAGAVVSGQTGTMPVVGGAIETLEFIPNDAILGGYGGGYLLGERAGVAISSSTEYRFVEDQTVIKGTARYDGKPAVPQAFVGIGIGGTKPAAGAVHFQPDEAN